jgi:RNA polymerase sigma-70 factor (family 1)
MQVHKSDKVGDLLLKIQNGEEDGFVQLFDLYRPKIYTTALRITKDEWVAEEILQDTFVKIWIGRETLGKIENFEAWLYTIARNITYNALKRMQRDKGNLDRLTQDSVTLFYPEADYHLQSKEFQQILENAIERLPPKQKITYQLIKEQNLKRDQAATQLNVSPETVKWNLDQAMRSIRAYCVSQMKDLPLLFFLHFLFEYF